MNKESINQAIEYLNGCRMYRCGTVENISALDTAIEVLKKQLPKEPIAYIASKPKMENGMCICGKSVHIYQSFCDKCGQRLEWGEIKKND